LKQGALLSNMHLAKMSQVVGGTIATEQPRCSCSASIIRLHIASCPGLPGRKQTYFSLQLSLNFNSS